LPFEIRNGADVLLRQAFLFFGSYGRIGLLISSALLAIYFFVKGKTIIKSNEINASVLFGMILEGCIYGLILFLTFNNIPNLLILGKEGLNTIEKLYLAIGAGIFEEFIFRFIFIGLFSTLFFKIFKINKNSIFFPILLCSSLIFSSFHYIGIFGDTFEWKSFLLRFTAGGYLGLIFYLRGFAICAISHIFYDFIIIQGIQ
jgi:hypothetical protein